MKSLRYTSGCRCWRRYPSITDSFPHPAPVALISQFHADLGQTLIYGLLIAVPTILIAGPLFSLTLKKYKQKPLATFAGKTIPEEALPSMAASMVTALLPVVLIATATICKMTMDANSGTLKIISIFGDPIIALMITLAYALYAFVIRKNRKMGEAMESLANAVKDIGMILLIIAGAGGLKQVLTDSGTSTQISQAMLSLHMHPLLAAWTIAAFIRICLGSATVAGLTAAGIVAPMMAGMHVSPSLMVLATGAGSLMFSHVNDSGFWLYKEYFNLSVKDTFKTWSMMETIVSVVGLIAVGIIHLFISR